MLKDFVFVLVIFMENPFTNKVLPYLLEVLLQRTNMFMSKFKSNEDTYITKLTITYSSVLWHAIAIEFGMTILQLYKF